MNSKLLSLAMGIAMLIAAPTSATFIVEIDTDGADDGVLTFSPNFSFGGDTTTASQSAGSSAVGLNDADSIFGGDGSAFDTYVYTYDLDVDGDNVPLAAGTALNVAGDVASGLAAGASGPYRVYATWPFTSNVSGGDSTFILTDDLSNTLFSVPIDQNAGGGTGEEWIFLGSANLDAARTYTLTQNSGAATFVSQRSSGVLFDLQVPEPATALLATVFGLGMLCRRK